MKIYSVWSDKLEIEGFRAKRNTLVFRSLEEAFTSSFRHTELKQARYMNRAVYFTNVSGEDDLREITRRSRLKTLLRRSTGGWARVPPEELMELVDVYRADAIEEKFVEGGMWSEEGKKKLGKAMGTEIRKMLQMPSPSRMLFKVTPLAVK